MAMKVMQEYLYSLKPSVDIVAWNKATGQINTFLTNQSKKFDAYMKAKQTYNLTKFKLGLANLFGKDTTKLDDDLEKAGKTKEKLSADLGVKDYFWGTLNKAIKGTTTAFKAATAVMNEVTNNIDRIADKSAEISNKFIAGTSKFVDPDTRNLMAKFGVSSVQAQGIGAVTEAMGISTSDFGRLTSGQIELYNQLMQVYQEGIDSIDTDKLKSFNDSVQEYQKMQAEFQIKLQLAVTKLFAESKTLPQLLDHVGDFFNTVTTLLGNPIVQTGFDAFNKLLDNVVKVANFALNPFGIFGKDDSKKNVTNNITVNSKVDARDTGYSASELFEAEAQSWQNNIGG